MSTPSLLNIPYLYKAGTLYSQIPESGAGDFTVQRTTTVANRSTRINKDGLIETVLDNVPRLDYPLGGAVNGCPALLVEPAATNLVLQSENFGNRFGVSTLQILLDVCHERVVCHYDGHHQPPFLALAPAMFATSDGYFVPVFWAKAFAASSAFLLIRLLTFLF